MQNEFFKKTHGWYYFCCEILSGKGTGCNVWPCVCLYKLVPQQNPGQLVRESTDVVSEVAVAAASLALKRNTIIKIFIAVWVLLRTSRKITTQILGTVVVPGRGYQLLVCATGKSCTSNLFFSSTSLSKSLFPADFK